jgi:phosphate-selective porin OprO/OprP
MFERIWQQLGRVTLGSCAALLLVAGSAQADDAAKEKEIKDLKARQEEQDKKIEYLQQLILQQQRTQINTNTTAVRPAERATVEEIVESYLEAKEAVKKAEQAKKGEPGKDSFFEVGSDLSMSASWNNGLWIESKQKDFRMHIGAYLQADSVWFQEPVKFRPATGAAVTGGAPGGPLGVPGSTGIGVFDDGTFLRRARFQLEGVAYENFEFNILFQGENVTRGVTFDEMWLGVRDLPLIGTFRVGHLKIPQGLESYSSSKFIPFIERGAEFDTFYTEFATGAMITNSVANQRMTWAAAIYKNEIIFNQDGAAFGDGRYRATGRVTALPIWEHDGRCMLHLGLSETYALGDIDRNSNLPGTNAATGVAPQIPFTPGLDSLDLFRFRTRPDLRDSINDFQGGAQTTFGNNNRMIDTGNIISPYAFITGTEAMFEWNGLDIQAEATWAHMDTAFYPEVSGGANVPGNTLFRARQHVGSLDFWGGYAFIGYFILPGKRTYDRRLGRYDRVVPDENFFLVRNDEDGSTSYGLGALEVLFRVTYIDLNDKVVRGGQLAEQTIGLNWHWNPNMRLMANYFWAERDVIAPPGFPKPANGTLKGFGLQAAIDF